MNNTLFGAYSEYVILSVAKDLKVYTTVEC